MPKSNQKSFARLRAILESATLAAVATAAASSPASAEVSSSPAAPTAIAPTAGGNDDIEELAHRLAAHLTEVPPMEAVSATAELATSDSSRERQVLAGALAWVFPLASDDILLSHLADDPDPAVRAAVARAVWARLSSIGDTGILRRLLGDADPDVRAAAWLAVRG